MLYSKTSVQKKAAHYLVAAGKRLGQFLDFTKAHEFLNLALKYEPTVQEKKEALCAMGRMAIIDCNPAEAEKYYLQALPLAEDAEEKVSLMLNIAWSYQRTRNLAKAEDLCKKSEEYIRLHISNPSDTIQSKLFTTRGHNAIFAGEPDKAQALLEKCLELSTSSFEQSKAHYGLASVLYDKANPLEALGHSQKALEIAKGDVVNTCQTIIHMSSILRQLGRFDEIEYYLEEALTMTEKAQYPGMVAAVLRQKALFLAMKGHFQEARSVSRKAIEMAIKINDKNLLASLKLRNAEYSRELGDWRDANGIFRELWREFYNTAAVAYLPIHILGGWAILYQQKGEFLITSRLLEKAKKHSESRNYHIMTSWLEIQLCKVSIALGNLDKAKSAIKSWRKLPDAQSNVEARLTMDLCEADIYLREGENPRVIETTSRMLSSIEGKKGFECIRGDTLHLMGKALLAQGKFKEGTAKLRESEKALKTDE